MSPGTDLTVPQEVELVDAVVHALHVLEDVGPRVWRGTQGGHVARLHTHTPRHSTAIIGAIRPSCMQRVAPHSLHERPSRVCRSRQGKTFTHAMTHRRLGDAHETKVLVIARVCGVGRPTVFLRAVEEASSVSRPQARCSAPRYAHQSALYPSMPHAESTAPHTMPRPAHG